MAQPQPVEPTQGTHRKSSASKGLMIRSGVVGEPVGATKIKLVIITKMKGKPVENVKKKTYVYDEDQMGFATLLSVDSERQRHERGGQGEGSDIRKDTRDNRDFLDSDKTPSDTRIYDTFNLDDDDSERELDEAGQYKVYVHNEEKHTHTFTPLSPPRNRSSQDYISRYLNENPAPSLGDIDLPRIAGTSGLNSQDKSFVKEKPSGDSFDTD
ncbi:hypothetical protein Tco_1147345 [Tanacetum coccineum]